MRVERSLTWDDRWEKATTKGDVSHQMGNVTHGHLGARNIDQVMASSLARRHTKAVSSAREPAQDSPTIKVCVRVRPFIKEEAAMGVM